MAEKIETRSRPQSGHVVVCVSRLLPVSSYALRDGSLTSCHLGGSDIVVGQASSILALTLPGPVSGGEGKDHGRSVRVAAALRGALSGLIE